MVRRKLSLGHRYGSPKDLDSNLDPSGMPGSKDHTPLGLGLFICKRGQQQRPRWAALRTKWCS